MKRRALGWLSVLTVAGSLLSTGCGGRAEAWDTPVGGPIAVGELQDAAILIDQGLNRAMILRAGSDQTLGITAVPLGKRIVSTTTSEDRKKFFVLSQGEPVRLRTTDEGPALTVFDTGNPDAPQRYDLSAAATSLVLDPTGKYAILYAGESSTGGFLRNPNELFFVDLENGPGPDNPHPRTLPSKAGGAPKRLTFTPELTFPEEVPADPRRFLVVETDRDLLLLDLKYPDRGEITLPLTNVHSDPRPLSPAGIAVDSGSVVPGSERPPTIAVRTNSDDSVLLFLLEHSDTTPGGNDFVAHSNLAPVGGIPSDIAFVQTKLGSRLAAVVPAPTPRALLVKVDDNQTMTATFSQPYQKLSLVTGLVSNSSPDGDQVLLWAGSGAAASVALWDLGAVPTAAQANIDTVKSVETITLDGPVVSVTDVLNNDFKNLKVLETTNRSLYVLNLEKHEARPLLATGAGSVNVVLGLDKDRAWGYEPTQANFGQIRLRDAHSEDVIFDQPIDRLLEVRRSDGGFSVLTMFGVAGPTPGLVGSGPLRVIVFDAAAPDVPTSRRYSSVMLERLAP